MKISNEFYERGPTIINFLRIFGTHLFPSMLSIVTGDRKQFHYLQIVFNNITRSLVLEFN